MTNNIQANPSQEASRVLVIGPGSLGLWLSAMIQLNCPEAKLALTGARQGSSTLETLKNQGFSYSDTASTNSESQKIQRLGTYETIQEAVTGHQPDIVIVAVKSSATRQVAEQLARASLKDDAIVVSVQNGLNDEVLRERLGSKVITGITNVLATRTNTSRQVKVQTQGDRYLKLGTKDGDQERLNKVVSLFQTAGLNPTTPDITRDQWIKLAWNLAFNTLSVIYEKTLGDLVEGHGPEIQEIMQDVAEIRYKLDCELEKGTEDENQLKQLKAEVLAAYKTTADNTARHSFKTSTLQEFEQNRGQTENLIGDFIEYLQSQKRGNLISTRLDTLAQDFKSKIEATEKH